MDVFQFEEKIEKERIEDKSGRIKFRLYNKACKIGHQGALEGVSMKVRSGKVSKGVSGGEESLSSLDSMQYDTLETESEVVPVKAISTRHPNKSLSNGMRQ
ncbi:hypothetical protein HMPREF9372_3536 [Sporosarcina newyorkensis 2681]|uniref:Uncharacterized protein n=1 Tax=Sporosarcina newyorkensis 2681 TaxID=1027292 RepID=F9DXK5_9BACL|nr:hypothetical protein HMPREF9372_3536 [Sporosarcina newyorkensis 2681]